MAIYTFEEIVEYARNHSLFYNELYKFVPYGEKDISKYPIINQTQFWEANSLENNRLLTGRVENGMVLKSGGTTGNPKYSYFTSEEWFEFVKISSKGFKANRIKQGDKIANLFYAGELYASFLYITFVIEYASIGVNFPITGKAPLEEIIDLIRKLNINIIAGVPTTIMKVFEYIIKNHIDDLRIDRILFGGESFYQDQRETIKGFFPNIDISSILYASVDGGELGYVDSTCGLDEHRIFDETTILEIVDEETGTVIQNVNIPGKIVITNLCRKLMPIIRYPAGDRAMWIEPKGTPNRKFKLLGRSEEGARIGCATLYIQDALKVIDYFKNEVHILNFQIVVTHYDNKDQGILRLVSQETLEKPQELANKIVLKLYEERPMLKELVEQSMIHPIKVEWITSDMLETNKRTGKTKRVIDKRFEG